MKEYSEKYRIDTEENSSFLEEAQKDLLKFGHQFSVAGRKFLLSRRTMETPWKDRNRETWIHQPYGTCVLPGAVF